MKEQPENTWATEVQNWADQASGEQLEATTAAEQLPVVVDESGNDMP